MLVVGADVIVKHNRRHGGSIMLNATNGGVLTEQEMRYFKVIEAPNNDSFQIASYDLRLGTCHYVFDILRIEVIQNGALSTLAAIENLIT